MRTIIIVSLHAICHHDKSTDSGLIFVSGVYGSVSVVCRGGRIPPRLKRMCKRLKPGPFSSSSLGLRMRLGQPQLINRKLLSRALNSHTLHVRHTDFTRNSRPHAFYHFSHASCTVLTLFVPDSYEVRLRM